MNPLLRAGFSALGFLGLCLAALPALAQDETDVVKKNDNSKTLGVVKSEDLKGCTVVVGKAEIVHGPQCDRRV